MIEARGVPLEDLTAVSTRVALALHVLRNDVQLNGAFVRRQQVAVTTHPPVAYALHVQRFTFARHFRHPTTRSAASTAERLQKKNDARQRIHMPSE